MGFPTWFPLPAHPRSRGEHTPEAAIDPLAIGSSPLTRGALEIPDSSEISRGLIPAHAGSCLLYKYDAADDS